jgi:type IV secretory pathway VirB2 component (pilin)
MVGVTAAAVTVGAGLQRGCHGELRHWLEVVHGPIAYSIAVCGYITVKTPFAACRVLEKPVVGTRRNT